MIGYSVDWWQCIFMDATDDTTKATSNQFSLYLFNRLQSLTLYPARPSYSLPRFCLLHNWVNRLALVFCTIAHPNWFTFCSFARHFQCGYFMWIVFSVIARAHTHTHTLANPFAHIRTEPLTTLSHYICCICFAYVVCFNSYVCASSFHITPIW